MRTVLLILALLFSAAMVDLYFVQSRVTVDIGAAAVQYGREMRREINGLLGLAGL
jgi:hypothetical protein